MFRTREVTDELEAAPSISASVDEILTSNWRAIQSWRRTGGPLQVFNIRMIGRRIGEIKHDISTIIGLQNNAFKLNYSYAYILRHKTSNRYRYYHASHNIGNILAKPEMIPTIRKFREFVAQIDLSESFDYARNQRQNTEYEVVCATNMVFYIYQSSASLIGGCADEDFTVAGRYILPLLYDEHQNRIRDNRCLFRAIAKALGHSMTVTSVFQFADKFMTEYPSIDVTKGVHLSHIPKVEECFGLTIVVYTRDDNLTGRILYPGSGEGRTIHLHLERRHYCYITDIKWYCRNYYCDKCGRMCVRISNFSRHSCNTRIKQKYPGGVFELNKTIFDELELAGVYVKEKFYTYRAVFDFESMLCTDNLPTDTEKITFLNKHEPLSVALASNIPGYESAIVHVSDGNSTDLVKRMFCTLEKMREIAVNLMYKRYQSALSQLNYKIAEAKEIDPPEDGQRLHPFEKLKFDFLRYIHQLPVIGFNSGKYDLNLIKKYILKVFSLEEINVIKKGNLLMSLSVKNFKFLDISLYMSPGCSYAQYLKAYNTEQRKGFFPYEFVTSISCLDYPKLPDHDAFYSKLKGTNISKAEYDWCVEMWGKLNMKSLRDWLIYYNKLDVEPFVEALEKQFDFYRDLGVDMFKDAISIPGVTERYVFGPVASEFTLLSNEDKDLHELFRSGITGGPSIINSRYQESGVTRIKQYKYGDEARVTRMITGWDSNSLYPAVMAGRVPTGFAIRYLPNADFSMFHRKKTEPKYGRLSLEWLTWMSASMKIPIRHQYNGKEITRGAKRIRVDGYYRDPSNGQVYSFNFHGCRFHGCMCASGDSFERVERQERTIRVTEYLEKLGDRVLTVYECEWKVMRRRADVKTVLDTIPKRDSPRMIRSDKLIDMVREDKFYGFLEIDLFTPENLKSKFYEFCPIFKNVIVTLDDLSPHMKEFGEKNGFMTRGARLLIASYFGKKILVNTDLLRWYLDHGLIVTKIYQAVEYVPKVCFRDFVEACANYRRMGDKDPNKSVLASTYKILANSAYGRTLTCRLKHCKVKYMNGQMARTMVNDPLFMKIDEVDDDVFEVTCQKEQIVWRDCIQIGLTVYMNAKLSLLSFFYDVLMKYIDDRDFCYLHSDTDSLYLSGSRDNIFAMIKPELRDEFLRSYHLWFPSISCDAHRQEFIEDPVNFSGERPCCKERYMYDMRTPGLWKCEYLGSSYIGLSSKTYICDGEVTKYACKGLSKRNEMTFDVYRDVLTTKVSRGGTNRSFILNGPDLFSYEQQRDCLSYFYAKRKVFPDGVNSAPLDL